ncbi:hypothetical protein OV203_45515 [Nannocystis sp. ILAH1]|uniref:hypothetical protein n=1 Tax=Nannocystis sp. ILAH1 TaxID=2996789 RepID=UPI00226F840F|nr:hypothetical protein [Nannocystis sp. ILAH1]MCY0994468.1 hypothetical protein [Nannocystis sp. ILAH1]
MTYFQRTRPFFISSLLAACGPGGPADTEGASSEGPPTSTTTGPATEGPTTEGPTTTSTTTTSTTTSEETTIDEPPAIAACERLAGPADGAVDWYLRCGGLQHEYLGGVATDAAGNIYLAAETRVLAGSQSLQIGEFEVTPGELSDILLIKLSSEGVPAWVRQFGGPGDQSVWGLVACGEGFVIHGWAEPGTLDLGGGAVEQAFLASFDGDGDLRWSRSVPALGGDAHVTFAAMKCDEAGTLALTGEFRSGVDFGGGPVAAPELYDGFVVTYDAAGEFQWVRQFGSTGDASARGRALAFTPAGEIVVAGAFQGSVDLGGGTLSTDFQDDMLIAKLSATGEHVWSQQVGSWGLQYGMAIAADSAGRVALGGMFLEEVEIGDDKYTNVFPDQIPDAHGTLYDAVLAQIDPAGAVLGSQHVGTMNDDSIDDLEFDAADTLLMTGFTADAFTLRAIVGQETSWEWTTDQFAHALTTLSGEDAIVVTMSPTDAVDLGAGPLAGRGESDLVVARIRR